MSENRADGPSPTSAPRFELRVEGPPDSGVLRATFLGPVHGTIGHWVYRKFIPCRGQQCPSKTHAVAESWLGFAGACYVRNGPPSLWIDCLIDVTPRLFAMFGDQVLRGTVWNLFKRPCGTGKVECTGEQIDYKDPRTLPREPTVESAVERMYHVRPMIWGKLPLWEAPEMRPARPFTEETARVQAPDPEAGFNFVRPPGRMTFPEVVAERERQLAAWRATQGTEGGGK